MSFSRAATRTATRSIRSTRTAGPARRAYATTAPPPGQAGPQVHSSHIGAGVAGGVAVIGAGYAWYHFSGTKAVVNQARDTFKTVKSVKDGAVNSLPSTKDALGLLKSAAKTYAVAIPGASQAIDASFDQLEKLAEKHGDKVQQVVSETYQDVVKATKDGKNNGEKVVKAVQEALMKLQKMAGEEGSKAFDLLGDKFPELKNQLGSQAQELQNLANKHGPEASKLASEFYDEASSIVTKGGLNAQTLDAVKKLLTDKSQKVQDLAQRSGRDAYEVGMKQVQPLMDKFSPDLQKLFEENADKLKSVVGEENVSAVKELYQDLEVIAKGNASAEDKTKAARELLTTKLGSLQDVSNGASDKAFKMLSSVPGFGGLANILGGADLKHLKDVAEKHGSDGEKLLNSTYDEIKDLLSRKGKEAKDLAERAGKDAKKSV